MSPYTCACACLYVCTFVLVYACVCVCTHVCVRVCVCVCVHLYVVSLFNLSDCRIMSQNMNNKALIKQSSQFILDSIVFNSFCSALFSSITPME